MTWRPEFKGRYHDIELIHGKSLNTLVEIVTLLYLLCDQLEDFTFKGTF